MRRLHRIWDRDIGFGFRTSLVAGVARAVFPYAPETLAVDVLIV